MRHPFLQNNFQIKWKILQANHIKTDINKGILDAQMVIDKIANQTGVPSYKSTILALDEGLDTLNRAWSLVSHLDSVDNNPELRAAYNAMLPKVSDFFASIPLNERLWKVIKAYSKVKNNDKLSKTKEHYLQETLTDFREAGADLNLNKKKRLREIQSQLAKLTQRYSENCLDATNSWEKIITDINQLSGLPQSAIAAARQSAKQKGKKGWRFTLQAPSYISVMTYLDSNAIRKEIWQAYSSVGRTSNYDNRRIVRKILDLRHELAQLLGHRNFADYVTGRRMAGSGSAALDFVNKLFNKVRLQSESEAATLKKFKVKIEAHHNAECSHFLEAWEVAYWAEKQRRANYNFNEELLRPYFPINGVISGMYALAQKIFSLVIKERQTSTGKMINIPSNNPETWHDDVKFYEVYDAKSGEFIGAFYADWHPREAKRGGAWFNHLLTGERDPTKKRSPHLGLICGNLTPAVGDQPALLTHREVETIFHEFGHLIHHLCGEVEVKSLNGVNVPWDFVELPSQLMENWCWQRESLDLFARHYKTGETIPEPLFNKMLAARNYMKASANVRQLAFAKMDLELHINWPGSTKENLEYFIETILKDYNPKYYTSEKSNVFNFGHLFSSPTGYAAGYYSYKWAEVLDADAFTRFLKEGILNPATGWELRTKILAKGNSEEPAKLYKDFMHREPDPDALLRRDNLVSQKSTI